MKLATLVLVLGTALFAADAPKPSTDADRLAAEKSRSTFYKLQAQMVTLQSQSQAAAADFNSKLNALRAACPSGEIDDDTLICKQLSPAADAKPQPKDAK